MAEMNEEWRNDTQNITRTEPLLPEWTRMLCQLQWAWEVHVYGAASLFCLMSVLCLLTVLRLNSQLTQKPHLSSLNIFLGILATSRFIVLFADPYGSRKALPVVLLQVLWDLGYPCLLSALSLLQLSFVRTTQVKMPQVSDENTTTVIITFHFCLVITTGVLAALQRKLRIVWLLVQVLFLVWGIFLCLSSLLGCLRLLRSLVTLRSVAQEESRHAMFLVDPPRICITGVHDKTVSMASLQVERAATTMPQRSETFPMNSRPNEGRPLMSIALSPEDRTTLNQEELKKVKRRSRIEKHLRRLLCTSSIGVILCLLKAYEVFFLYSGTVAWFCFQTLSRIVEFSMTYAMVSISQQSFRNHYYPKHCT